MRIGLFCFCVIYLLYLSAVCPARAQRLYMQPSGCWKMKNIRTYIYKNEQQILLQLRARALDPPTVRSTLYCALALYPTESRISKSSHGSYSAGLSAPFLLFRHHPRARFYVFFSPRVSVCVRCTAHTLQHTAATTANYTYICECMHISISLIIYSLF